MCFIVRLCVCLVVVSLIVCFLGCTCVCLFGRWLMVVCWLTCWLVGWFTRLLVCVLAWFDECLSVLVVDCLLGCSVVCVCVACGGLHVCLRA